MTAPATVKKVRKAKENSWLEVTIYEGRKHQVKRMFEAVGHPVLKLKRIRFGPLALGDLLPGEFRYLTDREANTLRGIFQYKQEQEAAGIPPRPIRPQKPVRQAPTGQSARSGERSVRSGGQPTRFPGKPAHPSREPARRPRRPTDSTRRPPRRIRRTA